MKKVLIVDDDLGYQKILGESLELEGISTIVAENGIEALQKLKLEKVDLILMDLLMPQMSGWHFIYELQKTKRKRIPIIILTNLSQTSYPSDIPTKVEVMIKANVSLKEITDKVKKRLHILQ